VWVGNLEVDGGGWRMPTRAELKSLYQKDSGPRNITPLLEVTGWWIWTGETNTASQAWIFSFSNGTGRWYNQYIGYFIQGLAVRSRR
jgi:hypothetical protein